MKKEMSKNIRTDKKNLPAKIRRIETYTLYCEGVDVYKIAEEYDVSEKTIRRDIDWCRENLDILPDEDFVKDIFRAKYHRYSILFNKFRIACNEKKFGQTSNNIIGYQKCISELEQEMLQLKGLTRTKIDLNFVDDREKEIFTELDKILRKKTPKELEDIINGKDPMVH